MGKIYKYFGKHMLNNFIQDDERISLKFTSIEEYNDPYEFFAPIDFNGENSETLSEYQLMKDSIKGLLASCFSTSPIIMPMWAHYGQDCQGFIIEFDVDILKNSFENLDMEFFLKDVEYRDSINPDIAEMINYAIARQKGRHFIWAEQRLWREAYFTKKTCWSYEKEMRLLVDINKTIKRIKNGKAINILNIPCDSVTAIIAGPKMGDEAKTLENTAFGIETKFYTMRIGKSTLDPYFVDDDLSYTFSQGKLERCSLSCIDCFEPLKSDEYGRGPDCCCWCEIEHMKEEQLVYDDRYDEGDEYGLTQEELDKMPFK